MNTLPYYSAILGHINSMKSCLSAVAYDFKEIAPRNALDEQLIDALIATSNEMLAEAAALKDISYDPTPEEPVDP